MIGIPNVLFEYPFPMDPVRISVGSPIRPPCLIVGCGYVGARLAKRLAGDRDVRAVVRSDVSAAGLRQERISTLQVDLDSPGDEADAVRAAADGASIVYLAPPPDAGTTDPRLARFLAVLSGARPVSLLYMSTTGVYGDTGGTVVTERAELAPASDRARRRVWAERTVIDWSATRRLRCVILRVPGIYGPHRLPLERLRRDEPVLRREDAGPGNRIHVDDLVSVCIAALDTSVSCAINVTDGDHASTTDYLCATAELAGLPPPRLVTREEAQAQISPGMLAFLNETRRVDSTRMREMLRVALRYPDMRSGIAASLEEMRAPPRE
jgi:nucleoside-diphosphate-sugar epimerase